MADRYQDRHFPPADQARGENDPLAELARLIGQNDPSFPAAQKPAARPLQSRANVRPQPYHEPEEEHDVPPPSVPSWMQRSRQETPPPPMPSPLPDNYDDEPDYQPAAVHPLHRYPAQQRQAPAQDYYEAPQQSYESPQPYEAPRQQPYEAPQQYADEPQQDPSRYDDALFGRLDDGEHDYQRDPNYPDDPYAYQGEEDYEEEPAPKKRRGGLMTVAAVLVLAVIGTGAAFGYRTFVGSPRSGEPPIIKADNSPTKVLPAPSETGSAKAPDRLPSGDGGERLVSREETPVDVTSRSGAPRVVFPALNPNNSPPTVASVSPSNPAMTGGNGTMPNNEPRRVRTLPVKGDPSENGGIPAGASGPPPKPATRSITAQTPAPGAPPRNPSAANASVNTPMALAPQADPAAPPSPARTAALNPSPSAPTSGGYLVQVSSQKSEADAQSSYRALQGKFPGVLGSQSLTVKRVDLGEKGIYYRAFAGPFSSSDEASQFCSSLKSAGGQCIVQRN